jgi:ABC-2 type transport system permease protein
MTGALVRKLFRDVRLALLIMALLLAAFQCLWAKITERISGEIVSLFSQQGISVFIIRNIIFQGPGKIIQTLMGGESIRLEQAQDMLSIGYVHPLVQTILCIWAIGRAAGAVAGEIDRGTMELLLAQPLARPRLLLAHLLVDMLTIPVLCLSLWLGTCLGSALVGLLDPPSPRMLVDPLAFAPSLMNVGTLVFAISGYTIWLSAAGRFRGRVLGLAVLLTLLQFLVNVIGQLWNVMEPLRPFTVFYYYQPQQMILAPDWADDPQVWLRLGLLLTVGTAGYLGALWTFVRRDLPAPL